jgi:hypothetical protein
VGAAQDGGPGGVTKVGAWRAAQIVGEPEKQMHYRPEADFGVDFESQGVWAGGPAFRCDLPFRGDGRLIRDAGSAAEFRARMVTGARIEVSWLPDVSWRKRIRFSNRK